MIHLLHTSIAKFSANQELDHLLRQLPEAIQREISQYYNRHDQYARAIGKLMLQQILVTFGYSGNYLKRIQKNQYGKPYIPDAMQFNITHSHDRVVCVAAEEYVLGVDTEYIAPLSFNEYQNCFSPAEWQLIKSATHPQQTFFEYWTKKESLLKAEGKGLSIDMRDVIIEGNRGKIRTQDNYWYFFPVFLGPDYITYLSVNHPDIIIHCSEFTYMKGTHF